MPLSEIKENFLGLMKELDGQDKIEFLRWIYKSWDLEGLNDNVQVLEDIADELRQIIPLTGVLPSEIIYEPVHQNKEEKEITLHIDEFLCNDNVVDKLVEEGKISRNYCDDCKSRNIKPLNLITHSCSIERMQFLFKELLPPMEKKTFLDIGSRLGAVLYGAYMFTNADKIIGIELHGEWCKYTTHILNTRNMQDRVDVIHSDLRNQANVVSSADVILVSNAFEYFADKIVAEDCWNFLIKHVQPGAIIVISPPASHTFELYQIQIPWRTWLRELQPYECNLSPDAEDFLDNMHAYEVQKVN